MGPGTVQPAGVAGVTAEDAQGQLEVSDISIVATAAEAVASPRWNLWVDGRYLYSNYTASGGGLDGGTWSGLAGADYKVTSKFTLGVMASTDHSDLESGLTDLDSRTLGVGPYLGLVLTDNIVFSASALRSWVDSEQAAGLLDFETDRVQLSAALNGYWYKDSWRFTPG